MNHNLMNMDYDISSCDIFRLEDVYLYGVFDGHEGTRASGFAAQRMPAEILLGQLDSKSDDAAVRECLLQVKPK